MLSKELQGKVRKIEIKYKNSFATTSRRTGQFLGFLYDIPLERLPKPIIDKKRRYEPEVINQVSDTLNQLLDEQIICEASDPQVVSNLIPVEKSLGERKLLPTLLPNQIWVIDTLAMPQSFGYS